MAGAGGLVIILLGGVLGILFVILPIGLLIYASLTPHPRRGYRASQVALAFALASAVLALPITYRVLSGHGSHGEPFTAGEAATGLAFAGIQVLVLLASLVSVLRRRGRAA